MKKISVVDEFHTIEKIKEGYSISRFGDGELQLVFLSGLLYLKERLRGRNPQVFENGGFFFSLKMKQVLQSDLDKLLIGIPNVYYEGAEKKWKSKWYHDNKQKVASYLNPQKTYYSMFFVRYNRIDEHCDTHWDRVNSIWKDKRIAIINFNEKLAEHEMFSNAEQVTFVKSAQRNAWGRNGAGYKAILKKCLELDVDLYLASCGPVATILAYDLTLKGRQCVDIGQLGRLREASKGIVDRSFY